MSSSRERICGRACPSRIKKERRPRFPEPIRWPGICSPWDPNIVVSEGDQINAGDIIAKIPRETTKTKDITGGLPRVAELFEARKPKEFAVISEIDGTVAYGKDAKGKRKVVITPEIGEEKEYLIPKGKHVSVQEGDKVRAGEALMDGVQNPHDLLMIKGEKELARYLVDEVQEVYRLQGVKINDKHMEVIVRQMLRRVKISEPGDTTFIADEQVERHRFQEENQRVVAAGGHPATGEPILLGITKASLSTQSFISAASFRKRPACSPRRVLPGKSIIYEVLKRMSLWAGSSRPHRIVDVPQTGYHGCERAGGVARKTRIR